MIINIIALGCLGHLAVDFIQNMDTYNVLPEKPFKCDMCMGYWISVLPLVFEYGVWGWALAAVSGVISNLLTKLW